MSWGYGLALIAGSILTIILYYTSEVIVNNVGFTKDKSESTKKYMGVGIAVGIVIIAAFIVALAGNIFSFGK